MKKIHKTNKFPPRSGIVRCDWSRSTEANTRRYGLPLNP